MKRRLLLSASVISLTAAAFAQTSPYDGSFTSDTMRIDFRHSGGPQGERIELARTTVDGAWAGSRTQLVDDTNLGQYCFEVFDQRSGRILYSRGFGSIFGEWATTAEVRRVDRTFDESLRFPWPKKPVRVVLSQRNPENRFEPLWTIDVDPRTVQRRTGAKAVSSPWTIVEHGSPRAKVDVLLISDRYSTAELPKFRADAKRLTDRLFSYEPFKSRQAAFNVRALDLPTERSSVRTEYNIFGLARYMLTYDNQALRDAVAAAPYDVVEVLVNSAEYGGGGIFNLQGTVAVDNPRAEYVFVHEFAHNFAGLGDEYVGNVTYETPGDRTVEPWEPNLSALLSRDQLKWGDLVEPGTPLPTPLGEIGKVGAFEGGGYQSRGLYRPEAECIMGTTRAGVGFCRVCQRAITRVIDLDAR